MGFSEEGSAEWKIGLLNIAWEQPVQGRKVWHQSMTERVKNVTKQAQTILTRMLKNLLSIYDQESDEQMARRVRAFLELLKNEHTDCESPH